VISINIVHNGNVERGDGAFFFVAADVQIIVRGAAIGEPVDQPGVAVIGKNDRFVEGEHGIELGIGEPVRILAVGLQGHQIDDIDDADFDVGKMLAQEIDSGQSFQRGDVTGTSHNGVRLGALIVAGPVPNPDAGGAVTDGRGHVQPLQSRLFAGDDDVDIVAAPQAVKIPHLLDLGITAVELLPIFQFDEQSAPKGLRNYWGYEPVSFFAPHTAYSSRRDSLACLDEFKDLVKALHRAGIEIILDVVYNHTAEGAEDGPTFCYRGFENEAYYLARPGDRSRCANYTGCGNTLNANHPVVRRMILDSVRYWVSTMHVDGFRFDLASILSRDESGRSVANAPLLADLESDPVFASTKLIAEAWDTELYQVGAFANGTWKEWNGKFRDQVRGFMKGDRRTTRGLANGFLGSPDLYEQRNSAAEQSINFITCHDGFTLNDLVSYNEKHNERNGEGNRDGSNDNLSWNCGIEGSTNDPDVELLRNRQVKNFLALTLLSAGTPMMQMGDEVRRTQQGNNNAYCQDNEIGWLDWNLATTHADILRFVKQLIRLRLSFESAQENERLSLAEFLHHAEIRWHGMRLNYPDWGDDSHSLAVTLKSYKGKRLRHFILNAYWEALEFELPPPAEGNTWHRLIDTALKPPFDIADAVSASQIDQASYLVQPRSVVLLSCETRAHVGLGGWRKLFASQ
jgi:isoamylase